MAKSSQQITGAVFESGRLEWTTLRPRKKGWETSTHKQVQFEGDPPPAYGQDELPKLIKGSGVGGDEVCVALSSASVLLRVVRLPATDLSEIAAMVELQVDQISPFPVDMLQVSFEKLSEDESGSRVLIAAVKRDLVDDVGDAFIKAGILPHHMDVDVLGWLRLIEQSEHLTHEGRQIILLFDRAAVNLIVIERGTPIVFRTLSAGDWSNDHELRQELIDETAYTLTSIEAEWGVAGLVKVTCWSWDALPTELTDAVQAESHVDVECFSFTDLPPVTEGIALRAATHSDEMLDLSPAEWHEQEIARAQRKKFVLATSVVLVLWLLLIGGFSYFSLQLDRRLNRLESAADKLAEPAREVRALRAKVQALEQYSDRTYSALECLREISMLLPDGVDLSSFVYKKNRSVSIRGSADVANQVYNFYSALENSELFDNIEQGGIKTKVSRGQRRSEFDAVAELPGTEEDAL